MTNDFWSGVGTSAVASILGFGGNLATSAINSSRAWKYTQRAMTYQDQLNRAYTRDSYGLMREGLEKAGYNPLLALGSGSNSAIYSGSGVNSDSDSGSQAVQSAIDALRLSNENKLRASQVKLNQSQEDLNTQNVYRTFAEELKLRQEARVASATEAKILNDIDWDNVIKDAEFKQIIANTKYLNERSRGFSASSSKSYGGSFKPEFSLDKKKGRVGFGLSGSGNYSKSESKSW